MIFVSICWFAHRPRWYVNPCWYLFFDVFTSASLLNSEQGMGSKIYIGMVYIMSNIGVVVSPAVVFSSFCAFSFSLFQPFHISNSWEREMSSLYSTSFWESGVKNRDIFYWSNTKKRYILAWATCKFGCHWNLSLVHSKFPIFYRYRFYADIFNEV